MARKKHSHTKGGRMTKVNSLALRGDALEILLDKWRSGDKEPLLKYRDAEKALRVNRKTARSVLRDIADISADIVIVSDGIRAGRDTYYHKHIRIAREAKDKMANKFASLIPQNVTLACSPGTSVAYCVRRLIEERQYHVIVTNNMGVLDMLARSDIANLVFTGGDYASAIHACVGNDAVEAFSRAKCQAALIGVSGISESGELFVRHSPEVGVLYQIVQSATNLIYIVADSHKFLQPDTWRFARIPQLFEEKSDLEIYLITCLDKSLSRQQLNHAKKVAQALQKMGVRLIWA